MRHKAKWVVGACGVGLVGMVYFLSTQPDYPFVEGCYAVPNSRVMVSGFYYGAKSTNTYVCYEDYDEVRRRVSGYTHERGSTSTGDDGQYVVSRSYSSSGAPMIAADMTIQLHLDDTGSAGGKDRVSVTVYDFGESWVTRLKRAFGMK